MIEAGSAQEAVDRAYADQPDLILLDVQMPDRNGYEVCITLKADQATRDIPIVFLTGRDSTDDEVKGLRIGATDFIKKPVVPEVLKTRVNLILKMRRMTKHLEYLARTDPLSGAFNRRHFMESFDAEIKRARRYKHTLCALMIDIDHFKSINDSYGHDVGDDAIKKTVDATREMLRSEDTLGRLGGEEFAVILPETDVEGARLVAERIRERISDIRIVTSQKPCTFTASLGLTEFRENDEIADMLKRSDEALYEAKEAGRDRVIVK